MGPGEDNQKPIIVDSSEESNEKELIDKNKKDLESFFSINLSKKTQAVISISALTLLVFVLGASVLPSSNPLLNNLYPKPSSYATDTNPPAPTMEPQPTQTASSEAKLKTLPAGRQGPKPSVK